MTRRQLIQLKSARCAHATLSRNQSVWEPAPDMGQAHEELRTRIRCIGDALADPPADKKAAMVQVSMAMANLMGFLNGTVDPLVAALEPVSPAFHREYQNARRIGNPTPGNPGDDEVAAEALLFEAELIREEMAESASGSVTSGGRGGRSQSAITTADSRDRSGSGAGTVELHG